MESATGAQEGFHRETAVPSPCIRHEWLYPLSWDTFDLSLWGKSKVSELNGYTKFGPLVGQYRRQN